MNVLGNATYNGKPFYEAGILQEIALSGNVSFMGNAIDHLSSSQQSINLDDWEWHEEEINGIKYCVVTDKLTPELFRLD